MPKKIAKIAICRELQAAVKVFLEVVEYCLSYEKCFIWSKEFIFTKNENRSGKYIVDLILDKAQQKATGKWTSQHAMDIGINVPTIDAVGIVVSSSSFLQAAKMIETAKNV